MSVRIRLTRRGRKKLALYDIIVADSRSPRDGKFIEKLGTYNPGTNPASVNLNEDKTFTWLMNGALPTDTLREMLSEKGIAKGGNWNTHPEALNIWTDEVFEKPNAWTGIRCVCVLKK